jgi:hypothetical protein
MDYDDGVADNGVHDAEISGGGFDDGPQVTGQSAFADHAVWFNYGAGQNEVCSSENIVNGGAKADGSVRSASLTELRVFHASTVATGYTIATGDSYDIDFVWYDGSQWVDASGIVTVAIGYYADEGGGTFDPTTDPFTVVSSIDAGLSTMDTTWEQAGGTFPDVAPAAAAGKTLYLRVTANDRFGRIDNITLTATTP